MTETETETPVQESGVESARSPEEQAAEQALARASTPPQSVGGPGVEPDANGAEPDLSTLRRTGRAAQLAEQRHDGDDVAVAEDDYLESRERVAAGSQEDADLEAVTEWLLSDDAEVNTRKLTVRVGGPDSRPLIIPWFIRAIGIDVIRSAEREAAGNRQQRRGGGAPQYDELKANLRIVVEGTAAIGTPDGLDLKGLARQKGIADATVWLERKLRYRPGAIAQIAGEVMALSGFDTEDVRAAGN